MVKVEKTATTSKRMTVSDQLELSNDYIVFFPTESVLKISSKIPKQKAGYINTLLNEQLNDCEGVLVRTVAQHMTDELLIESVRGLRKNGDSFRKKRNKKRAPSYVKKIHGMNMYEKKLNRSIKSFAMTSIMPDS